MVVPAERGSLQRSMDAAMGAAPGLPCYLTALLVSQPLHFGDYGGMPMKIIWALLDVAALIVLGSGLYLRLKRPPSPANRPLRARR